MTCTTSIGAVPDDDGGSRAVRLEVVVLDDTSGIHAEMWEIRLRHEAGTQTIEDARRYRALWQALALRRSVGRRTYLPPELDDLLIERARLSREIQVERTRQAVEAVFESAASAGTLPA